MRILFGLVSPLPLFYRLLDGCDYLRIRRIIISNIIDPQVVVVVVCETGRVHKICALRTAPFTSRALLFCGTATHYAGVYARPEWSGIGRAVPTSYVASAAVHGCLKTM